MLALLDRASTLTRDEGLAGKCERNSNNSQTHAQAQKRAERANRETGAVLWLETRFGSALRTLRTLNQFRLEVRMTAATGELHAYGVTTQPRRCQRFTATLRGSPTAYGRVQANVRVLLIEDDSVLAARTAEYLREHEADVDLVGDGPSGLECARLGQHDIVLLDLMLPGLSGLELCRELRRQSNVPVIMLSARGEEVDRVVGLEIGADDYLPKPFSPRELLARIRAVLRRRVDLAPGKEIRVGLLTMDRARRVTWYAGQPCDLTPHQFDLLWVLAQAAGRVLSRAEIHQAMLRLRGEPANTDFDPAVDRSIDVHLSKVRQSLASADAAAATMIRTIRGVGYVLSDRPI